MANKDAAFGMRPVGRVGGTPYTGGTSRYRIANNYGTAIFQGDMVAQVTGGGIEVHADGGTVPPSATFNSAPEIPVVVLPALVYTISKFPNKSAIGIAAFA